VTFLAVVLLQVDMRMIRCSCDRNVRVFGWLDKRPIGQRSKTKPKI